jgi:hypothetical protein
VAAAVGRAGKIADQVEIVGVDPEVIAADLIADGDPAAGLATGAAKARPKWISRS